MEKEAIIDISGQKAIKDVIMTDMPINQDLARLAPKYPKCFGKVDEVGSYANMIATNSLDQSASTVKIKCKDSSRMALDITLPWDQAAAEISKINGPLEIKVVLAGIVGVAK